MDKAKNSDSEQIKLPMLEDSASIQVAITQITTALLSSRIDERRAGLLLYALQIASQNITRSSSREAPEMVHSMTVTGEGDELAPEKEFCEKGDCASCNRRETCKDYDPIKGGEKVPEPALTLLKALIKRYGNPEKSGVKRVLLDSLSRTAGAQGSP
jgi:hypothetical protein